MKANNKAKFNEPGSFKEFRQEQSGMWNLLVEGVFAVIIIYATMNIGSFINGTIGDSLYDTYPAAASRSVIQNYSVASLENLSSGFSTNVGMVNVVAQIALIIIPLMMVMFIRKMAG
jgi:hypothetical protein